MDTLELKPTKKEIKNAVYEVEIIYKRPLLNEMQQVTNSFTVEKLFREIVDPNRIDLKEFFFVMLLSSSNHVLGISQIGVGATKGTVVNIKEVFQLALRTNASGIILAHNHPSGGLKPSKADEEMTQRIQRIGELMEIKLFDHLILSSEGYFSFTDEGLIEAGK